MGTLVIAVPADALLAGVVLLAGDNRFDGLSGLDGESEGGSICVTGLSATIQKMNFNIYKNLKSC